MTRRLAAAYFLAQGAAYTLAAAALARHVPADADALPPGAGP